MMMMTITFYKTDAVNLKDLQLSVFLGIWLFLHTDLLFFV